MELVKCTEDKVKSITLNNGDVVDITKNINSHLPEKSKLDEFNMDTKFYQSRNNNIITIKKLCDAFYIFTGPCRRVPRPCPSLIFRFVLDLFTLHLAPNPGCF